MSWSARVRVKEAIERRCVACKQASDRWISYVPLGGGEPEDYCDPCFNGALEALRARGGVPEGDALREALRALAAKDSAIEIWKSNVDRSRELVREAERALAMERAEFRVALADYDRACAELSTALRERDAAREALTAERSAFRTTFQRMLADGDRVFVEAANAKNEAIYWESRSRFFDTMIRKVEALLAANGCDCECEEACAGDHDEACERCLACRVGEAIQR